ncbi:Glycine cleavage system transcriptional activator [Pseudovibrio axinellae]|uniref:Glycine cleavage system transcriptional activator n=1 Tax=Pseudovibrio axinellae TaxID=989403 RepID=A0A161V033_9HYPH|nr:transcriptional regulator GcvA [Pseudovibrio axinellae]KZL08489.1 Glycine cleavage system transcriptional activator [Pseudovibrio axinellae]SEP75906.1 LysR family transcriptional regulator, glycine cleavage system transcriptional activator [Pseudovibrio axinellae]
MRYSLPPLNAFRAFECVARHMSFARAAEELNLTPSALSYQIKSLEDQLQVPLFLRLNRAIDLTPAGRSLLPGVENGLNSFSEAVARVKGVAEDNVLVISTGPGTASKVIAPRIYKFMEAFPEIELRISASLKLVDFYRDDVDLGLRFGRGHYRGLKTQFLIDDYLTPMCSPRLASQISTPCDLRDFKLLHDGSMAPFSNAPNWREWLQAASVEDVSWASKGLVFSQIEHAQDAAIEGAGIMLGRKVLCAHDKRLGLLKNPFELHLPATAHYMLVGLEKSFKLKKCLKFVEWIRAELDSLCPS